MSKYEIVSSNELATAIASAVAAQLNSVLYQRRFSAMFAAATPMIVTRIAFGELNRNIAIRIGTVERACLLPPFDWPGNGRGKRRPTAMRAGKRSGHAPNTRSSRSSVVAATVATTLAAVT